VKLNKNEQKNALWEMEAAAPITFGTRLQCLGELDLSLTFLPRERGRFPIHREPDTGA